MLLLEELSCLGQGCSGWSCDWGCASQGGVCWSLRIRDAPELYRSTELVGKTERG